MTPLAVAVTSAKPVASANALDGESVALAPGLALVMKYTRTCGVTAFSESVTFTRSFWVNAVFTGVDCGLPLVSTINFGKLAMFFNANDLGAANGLFGSVTFIEY